MLAKIIKKNYTFKINHQLFFYLTIVFLPSQLGYHFWPDWSMVLGRRIDYLSPTIYFTDILILLTVVLWLFDGKSGIMMKGLRFRNYESGSGKKKIINKEKEVNSFTKFQIHNSLFIILLVAFTASNIYLSPVPQVALYKWIKLTEFFIFGLYIYKTKPELGKLSSLLIFTLFYSSILAISQFIRQSSIGGWWWFLGERNFSNYTPGIARFDICFFRPNSCSETLRSYATFPHPNVLGGFIAVTIPLVFLGLIKNKHYSPQVKILFILLLAVCLLTTFSRSAITLSIITGIYLYLMNRKKIKSVIPLLFSALVLITILLITFKAINFNGESVQVRNMLNRAAWLMFKEKPLSGTGLGNYITSLPEYIPGRQINFLQPVHNIYLIILSETGLSGIFIIGYLIYKYRKLFKTIRKKPLLKLSVYSIFILGFFDHYFFTLQQGQLITTVIMALALI